MLLLGRGEREARLPLSDDWFLDVREESPESIEVTRRDRIEFVIVTLCTADRGAQPHGADRADSVREHARFIILRLRPAFLRGEQEPIKARRHLLLLRTAGQQISRDLLDRELVERTVAIEGRNDVVTVGPD